MVILKNYQYRSKNIYLKLVAEKGLTESVKPFLLVEGCYPVDNAVSHTCGNSVGYNCAGNFKNIGAYT